MDTIRIATVGLNGTFEGDAETLTAFRVVPGDYQVWVDFAIGSDGEYEATYYHYTELAELDSEFDVTVTSSDPDRPVQATVKVGLMTGPTGDPDAATIITNQAAVDGIQVTGLCVTPGRELLVYSSVGVFPLRAHITLYEFDDAYPSSALTATSSDNVWAEGSSWESGNTWE